MNHLADRQCESAKVKLDVTAQAELLSQLPGWQIHERNQVRQLEREFRFANFIQAMAFANEIAQLAEAANHHPVLNLAWGQVIVRWWTHSLNGLHLNDFILAARTDRCYQQQKGDGGIG